MMGGLSAIMNGMALHKGIIPYVETQLISCDFFRHTIRISALYKQ